MARLRVLIVQPDIYWEDKEKNLAQYEAMLEKQNPQTLELVVFPEMFTTGFSMHPEALAEPMDGPSVQWMLRMAKKYFCAITGSLMIRDQGRFYNRLLWVLPDGQLGSYDKRHLFGLGGEKPWFTPGNKRLIAQLKGFRICLQICYDLRFPVWSRNRDGEYDLLINVANWPKQRIEAWDLLLRARAIENQSYVLGVNRVGIDPQGNHYPGHSALIGPGGEMIWKGSGQTFCSHQFLDLDRVSEVRKTHPFLEDGDAFYWGH